MVFRSYRLCGSLDGLVEDIDTGLDFKPTLGGSELDSRRRAETHGVWETPFADASGLNDRQRLLFPGLPGSAEPQLRDN